MLGKIEGKWRRRGQRIKWLDNILDSSNINVSKLWETVKDRGSWHAAVHGVAETDLPDQLNTNKYSRYEST